MPYESKPPSVLPEDVMALMVAFEGMLPAVPVDVDAGADEVVVVPLVVVVGVEPPTVVVSPVLGKYLGAAEELHEPDSKDGASMEHE